MIYAIQGAPGTPVKIGYSMNEMTLRRRIKTLQSGYPYPLRVLFEIDGPLELEQRIHKALADQRLLGEWFEGTPKVEDFVKRVRQSGIEWTLGAFEGEEPDEVHHGIWLLTETATGPVFRIGSTLIRDARLAGNGPPHMEAPCGRLVKRYYYFNHVRDWLEKRQIPYFVHRTVAANHLRETEKHMRALVRNGVAL